MTCREAEEVNIPNNFMQKYKKTTLFEKEINSNNGKSMA